MRSARAARTELSAVSVPKLACKPRCTASAKVSVIAPDGNPEEATLPWKLPLPWTELVTVSMPPLAVFCSVETDPGALPRPDSGSGLTRLDSTVVPGDTACPQLATTTKPPSRISCAAVGQ